MFIVTNLKTIVSIPYIPAADVEAGSVVSSGSLIGYTPSKITAGSLGELVVTGMGGCVKASGEAWTVGAPIYYSSTNSNFTTTATDNTFAGLAVEAAASADTYGKILFSAGTQAS